MAFRDLVFASTFWGRSACGPSGNAAFETVHLAARNHAGITTNNLLNRILRKLRSGADTPLLKDLKIKCNGKKYLYASYVGGGTFGRVYKFTSAPGTHLAIKFIPHADHLPPRLPPEMVCNVIKSAVFANGQVLVMELGDLDVADLDNTPAAVEAVAAFSNEAALCLVRNNLVCTDWKLSNLTVFTRHCPGIRIIDPDGILICQTRGQWYPVTFLCTWIPAVPQVPTKRERNISAARAYITTAYNIELGKCLFEHNLASETDFLAGLGQRDRELAMVSRTMAALENRRVPEYARVLDLLDRLQLVDQRILVDDDAYDKTLGIIVEWFSKAP